MANAALLKWWKAAFLAKIFGGKYKMSYFCIKINDHGKGNDSF